MPQRRTQRGASKVEGVTRDLEGVQVSSSAARSITSTQPRESPECTRPVPKPSSILRTPSHPLASSSVSLRGSLPSTDGSPSSSDSQQPRSDGQQVSQSPRASIPVVRTRSSGCVARSRSSSPSHSLSPRDTSRNSKTGRAATPSSTGSSSRRPPSARPQRQVSSSSPRSKIRSSTTTQASGATSQSRVQRQGLNDLDNLPRYGKLALKERPYFFRAGCAENAVSSETVPIQASPRPHKRMPINDPHEMVEKACLVMRMRPDPIEQHLTAVDLPDLIIPAYNDRLPSNLARAGHLWILLPDGSWAPDDFTSWKIHDADTHDELDFRSPDLRWNCPDSSSWKQSFHRMWKVCTKLAYFDIEFIRTDIRKYLQPGNAIAHAHKIRRLFQALIKFEWFFENEEASTSEHVSGFMGLEPMPWNLTRLNNWKQNSSLDGLTRTEALMKLEEHDLTDAKNINDFYEKYLAIPQDSCNIYRWQITRELDFLGVRPWTTLNLDSDFIAWIDFTFNFMTVAFDCPLALLMTFPDTPEGLRHFMTGKAPPPGTSLISRDVYNSGGRRRYKPSKMFQDPGPRVADPLSFISDTEVGSARSSPRR